MNNRESMPNKNRTSLTGALTFLVSARLVLNTGYRFIYPFLPVIARGLGIPLTQAGLLVSARWITGLATPAAVRIIGRGERRHRLIVAGLAMFATGAVVTAATGVFAGALVGFVLLGLGKPTFDVAAQAYLSDRTPYPVRARYLGVIELTWAGSLLVGAPAAGWLIARFGWTAPFWAVAVLSVLALLAMRWVIEPDSGSAEGARPRLALDRSALTLLVTVALYSGASEIMFVVFGAWLEDGFGLSLLALGAAGVLLAVSELVGEGSTLVWTDRIGKRRSVAIGLVISALAYLLLAATNANFAAGMATMALALAGFEFTIVSTFPLASEVRPLARTRFLALLTVGMGLGRAAGASIGPFLYEQSGLTANTLVAAAANVIALVLLVSLVREAQPQE
ncbi:MAG: MFS transporter [Acidimicrobiia bacterium]|nr:MFS transporter [Acidimicrobiia bacterium]MDH5615715.1 MFS transporter [Acidimicrobiia bacterium]